MLDQLVAQKSVATGGFGLKFPEKELTSDQEFIGVPPGRFELPPLPPESELGPFAASPI
ncbi:hypothetical protein [Cryobacterium algoricola]|uniref:hypothetical protein n=1 Tax=Cryobacterium algoricola TaxID=1259183 RepID=UPI00141B6161|nr:hypothetical protein [Cryobacterium algoricola]